MRIDKAAKQYLKQFDYRLHQAKLALKQSGFSNFGEERIIKKHLAKLLPKNHAGTVVDIGAGDGVKGSNTYALFKRGWKGLSIDASAHNLSKLAKAYRYFEDVSFCRFRVTPQNILPLLEAYEIEEKFSLLSLDIDGNDYWVLDSLLSRFRPYLVVTEINEKIPPPLKFRVKYDPNFKLTHHFYGYSIASLEDLCQSRGYALVQLEYNNAFLVPKELAVRQLTAAEAYREGYAERPDRQEKFPKNYDMETLLSMSPENGLKFINQFFARHAGRYELSIDDAGTDATVSRGRRAISSGQK